MKERIEPTVEIRKGSIATVLVDAIVNPANSYGYMGGGVALAIKKVGGDIIEDEAIAHAPLQVGHAAFTTAGDLPCKHVIHAPTMHDPAEKTDEHKIRCAVEAALEIADKHKFKSIAFPGMGTGVGQVSKEESAKAMLQGIREFEFKNPMKIILIDIDEKMVSAWKAAEKILN